MLKPIFTIAILFIALIVKGQNVSSEEFQKYIQGPTVYLGPLENTFREFDLLAQKGDVPALKENVKVMKEKAKALQNFLANTKPLNNETWYLPAIQQVADKYSKAADTALPEVIGFMEKGDKFTPPILFSRIQDDLNSAYSGIEVAQYALAGQLTYDETSEAYCNLKKFLEQVADKKFSEVKGEALDTKGNFNVINLPKGLLRGSIKEGASGINATFVLHHANSFEEALGPLEYLFQVLLPCDGHEQWKPSFLKVTAEEIAAQRSPALFFMPKDEVKTKYYYVAKIIGSTDPSNPGWDVVVVMIWN